jgi:hypothetical protein
MFIKAREYSSPTTMRIKRANCTKVSLQNKLAPCEARSAYRHKAILRRRSGNRSRPRYQKVDADNGDQVETDKIIKSYEASARLLQLRCYTWVLGGSQQQARGRISAAPRLNWIGSQA